MSLNRSDIIDENAFDDSIRNLSDEQLLGIKFGKVVYPTDVFRRVNQEIERRGIVLDGYQRASPEIRIDQHLFWKTNGWWFLLIVLLEIWIDPLIGFILAVSLVISLWPSRFNWRHFQWLAVLLILCSIGISFLLAQKADVPYF